MRWSELKMKKIQYSVNIVGSIQVPDNANDKDIETLILADYWEYEPNDIEWEEIKQCAK